MAGWSDYTQTKAAQPVQNFGNSRGTGGGNPYARVPAAGAPDMGARSRFGALATPRPAMGGGMDGPPRQSLNVPGGGGIFSANPGMANSFARTAMPGGATPLPPPGAPAQARAAPAAPPMTKSAALPTGVDPAMQAQRAQAMAARQQAQARLAGAGNTGMRPPIA